MTDTITLYKNLFEIGLTKKQVIEALKPITLKLINYDSIRTKLYCVSGISFSFTITDTTIRMIGSLCKFYNGDNLNTLRYRDMIKAIVKLNSVTRLPIHSFHISRLDISDNIATEEPPFTYIGLCQGIERHTTEVHEVRGEKTGKYFIQAERENLLYDKFKEYKFRKNRRKNRQQNGINNDSTFPVMHDYFIKNGTNVLRFEVRLKRNLKKAFGKPLLLRDLARTSIWKEMVKIWSHQFDKMRWDDGISIIPSCIKNVKELSAFIMRMGIEYLGGEFLTLKMIEAAQKRKVFTHKSQGTRLKQKVRAVVKKMELAEYKNSKLSDEIKNKVKLIALKHSQLT